MSSDMKNHLKEFTEFHKNQNQLKILQILDNQFEKFENYYQNDIINNLENNRKKIKIKNEEYLSNRFDLELISKRWVLNNEILHKILNRIYIRNLKKRIISILRKNLIDNQYLKRNEKIASKTYQKNLKIKYFYKIFNLYIKRKREVKEKINFDRFQQEITQTKNIHEEYIKKLQIILNTKNQELNIKVERLKNLKNKYDSFNTITIT